MENKVKKEKTAAKITVKISPKEMLAFIKQAYDRFAPGVKIDGFRPGKAPQKLVEAAIGINKIISEALDLAINDSYFKVLVENKINAVSAPKIVINKYPNYGHTEEEIANELEYEAEVEFLPEVELGDYSKLKVEKSEPKKASDEDLQKVLEHFRKQAAAYSDKEGKAEKGDYVEINFEGFLKKVRIDQMCSKNHPVILGEGSLIPGFEDNLIGMQKGEKKEFKIKFPKDYHAKEYAGKEAEFKVEMLTIKKIEYPELDSKFAEKFGHKNMKDLEKAIRENLDFEYKHEHEHEVEAQVLEKVLPLLKAEIPSSLVEKEAERMLKDYADQLQKQGVSFERYLASAKKTREDLLKEMYPHAERNIKIGLVLGKIIEEKKLDPNKPESTKKALEHLIKAIVK